MTLVSIERMKYDTRICGTAVAKRDSEDRRNYHRDSVKCPSPFLLPLKIENLR